MLAVVDANELFSLLIKGNEKSEMLFFSENIDLLAPEKILLEFARHRSEILKKTHRSNEEFSRLLGIIAKRVELVPKEEYSLYMPKALSLLPTHPKDAQYLAVSLKYSCILWSEEKLLKRQSAVMVLNTQELFEKLVKKP
jgi:predicted nucleic acid-binding protein